MEFHSTEPTNDSCFYIHINFLLFFVFFSKKFSQKRKFLPYRRVYTSMRYSGSKNPYGITHLWEVRLSHKLMEKIRQAARYNATTMSWVVRFCIFRLARKKRIALSQWQSWAKDIKESGKQDNNFEEPTLHRFNVCLYGEDEKVLLELKIRTGLTTSMVIRIALSRFLTALLQNRIPWWRLFWYGLKFHKESNCFYSTKGGFLAMDFHSKKFFSVEDYHGQPPGKLPKYLKNTNLP